MSVLSDQQIANYAKVAGFTGNSLVQAIAIVLAESRGDTSARGYNRDASGNVTSTDRGLWQINSYYHSEVSDNCAYDAQCSSQAAFRISSHGQDFTPWATFNSGAYKAFMSRALTASGTGSQPSTPPPTPSTTNASGGTGVGSQVLGFQPIAVSDIVDTQTLSEGTGDNASAYRTLLAWGILLAFVMIIGKTRVGYVAIYYSECLILLFLVATQARFFKEALSPLSSFTSPVGQ